MSSALEFTRNVQPYFFYVAVILIVLILAKNAEFIKHSLRKYMTLKKLLVLLGAAVILTFFVTNTAPRTRRILYDESIYVNNAQNISKLGKNQYCVSGSFEEGRYSCSDSIINKQPPGYPSTLSLFFQIFQPSWENANLFNNVILLINILLVFLAVLIVTNQIKVAAISSVIFALTPVIANWHNTAAVEPVGSMYAGLTLLAFLIFYRSKRYGFYLLGWILFALATATRYEMILLIVPIGFITLLHLIIEKKPKLKQLKKLIPPIFLSAIFFIPTLVQYLVFKDGSWGAINQPKLEVSYFSDNLSTNIQFFTTNLEFPLLAFFLLAGLVLIKKKTAITIYYVLAFIVLFSPYLFFYAGSYQYGADIRYAVNSVFPVVVLVGIAFGAVLNWLKFKHLFILFAIPLLLNSLMLIGDLHERGEEGWQAVWDTEFIHNKVKAQVQQEDIIYTNTAYVYHLDGMNGRSTDLLYNKPFINQQLQTHEGKVYFHFGYWCSLQAAFGSIATFCTDYVLNNYVLDPVVSETRADITYTLYEITGVKQPGIDLQLQSNVVQ